VGQPICAVCCGTKRLVEIQCPSDCSWLAGAREHPPAAAVRQNQRDVAVLVQGMRDLSQRQSRLFFVVSTCLVRYEPPEFQALLDEDVVEAATALAGTFETAARGVIYDHRPASLPAERLAAALKPAILEAGQGAGSSFERDAAVVLRRVAKTAVTIRGAGHDQRRPFLDLLGRVISKTPEAVPSLDRPLAGRL
jgi:hypothetical protein